MDGWTGQLAASAYLQQQVTQAGPVQIVVMLYDGAVVRLRQSIQEMARGNSLAAGIALYRALAILGELRRSLNRADGGTVAEHLDRLYAYMHGELVSANLERSAGRIDAVLKLLGELRGAWGSVVDRPVGAAGATGSAGPPRSPSSVPPDYTSQGGPAATPRVAAEA